MWLTRALNIVKKHTNEYTGFFKESLDNRWGRRKVKMITAHCYGRQRNCYRVAIRVMGTSLKRATKARAAGRKDFTELSDARIDAGARELNYEPFYMRECLSRINFAMSRKVLANLAISEPRTFRAIVALSCHKENQPVERGGLGQDQHGPQVKVIDRGLF